MNLTAETKSLNIVAFMAMRHWDVSLKMSTDKEAWVKEKIVAA